METIEELSAYIAEKLEGKYTYETHPDAVADIAKAAFDFAADKLGASGWTASRAELLFLAKSRGIEGPFAIVTARDMLYPQSWDDVPGKYQDSWMEWASKQAKVLLAEKKEYVHPDVLAHWQALADWEPDVGELDG